MYAVPYRRPTHPEPRDPHRRRVAGTGGPNAASRGGSAVPADADGRCAQPMLRPQANGLPLASRRGGLFIAHWGRDGAVLAVVTRSPKDRHLASAGPFHLGLGAGVASLGLLAN